MCIQAIIHPQAKPHDTPSSYNTSRQKYQEDKE